MSSLDYKKCGVKRIKCKFKLILKCVQFLFYCLIIYLIATNAQNKIIHSIEFMHICKHLTLL